MDSKNIRTLMKRLQKAIPNPKSELVFHSPFELLIAVMLSAQATDVSVNKATALLFPVANTPKKILALGLDGIKPYLKTINLYPTKCKNIIATCELLIKNFKGKVPQTRKELETLPGVGRKTANVVLNTAFQIPVIAVDTHIFRVANRTKLAPGKTPLEVEEHLTKVLPKEFLLNSHHYLLLHGRYTCTARNPKCQECSISSLCEFEEKT